MSALTEKDAKEFIEGKREFNCEKCGSRNTYKTFEIIPNLIPVVVCKDCWHQTNVSDDYLAEKKEKIERMKDVIAEVYVEMFGLRGLTNDNYIVLNKLSVIEATIGDRFLRHYGYKVEPRIMDDDNLFRELKVSIDDIGSENDSK